MKFIFPFIVLVVVPGFSVHLTRRSEHGRDGHLLQAIHVLNIMTQHFQSILNDTPDKEKVAYISKMKEELGKMRDIFKKLRDFDWFDLINPSAEITKDECRLLSIWDEMTELLPEPFDESDDTNFGHFLGQCLAKLYDINYSEFSDGEFRMAQRKVLDAITTCEANGFSQALNALDLNNFDMNDARSVIATLTKIAEILKEVQHLGDFELSYVLLEAQQYDSTDKFPNAVKDATKNIHEIFSQMPVNAYCGTVSGGELDERDGFSDKTGSPKNRHAVQKTRRRSWKKKISDATRNVKARVVQDLRTRLNGIRRRNLLRSMFTARH